MSIETEINLIEPAEGQDTTPDIEVLTVITTLSHHEIDKVIAGQETPEGVARRAASSVQANLEALLSDIPESVRERVEASAESRAANDYPADPVPSPEDLIA